LINDESVKFISLKILKLPTDAYLSTSKKDLKNIKCPQFYWAPFPVDHKTHQKVSTLRSISIIKVLFKNSIRPDVRSFVQALLYLKFFYEERLRPLKECVRNYWTRSSFFSLKKNSYAIRPNSCSSLLLMFFYCCWCWCCCCNRR
jgi:hypothetical protein